MSKWIRSEELLCIINTDHVESMDIYGDDLGYEVRANFNSEDWIMIKKFSKREEAVKYLKEIVDHISD